MLTHSEALLSCIRCSHTQRLCCRVLDARTLRGFPVAAYMVSSSVLSVLVTVWLLAGAVALFLLDVDCQLGSPSGWATDASNPTHLEGKELGFSPKSVLSLFCYLERAHLCLCLLLFLPPPTPHCPLSSTSDKIPEFCFIWNGYPISPAPIVLFLEFLIDLIASFRFTVEHSGSSCFQGKSYLVLSWVFWEWDASALLSSHGKR